MAESHWPEHYTYIEIPKNTVLSQTIIPLFSHEFQYLRLAFKGLTNYTKLHITLRFAFISGQPYGLPLLDWTYTARDQPYPSPDRKHRFDSYGIRVVVGFIYSITIDCLDCHPADVPSTRIVAPPGGYPRGKLIKSDNSEETWDFTDLGDLCFNEWGYPPLEPRDYAPPMDYWTIAQYQSLDYNTASCIRIGSTTPSHLTILIAVEKPTPTESYKTVRGVSTLCLDHYVFKVARSYPQLEKDDTLYHTFHIKKLKQGQPYWFALTATADYWPIPSTGPVFHKIHPEAPPFTTIKRPHAPGNACNPRIDGNGLPCPNHYHTINESTPDEDASMLYDPGIGTTWATDLYNIPDLEPFDRPIKEVHIVGRFKNMGTRTTASVARSAIMTHGTLYENSITIAIFPEWQNVHWHLYLNPFTGLAWTRQEINDLQLGLKLRYRSGIGWGARGYCTQTYLIVEHDCSAYE